MWRRIKNDLVEILRKRFMSCMWITWEEPDNVSYVTRHALRKTPYTRAWVYAISCKIKPLETNKNWHGMQYGHQRLSSPHLFFLLIWFVNQRIPNRSVWVDLVQHSDEDWMMENSMFTYIMVTVLWGTLSRQGKLDIFVVTSSMFCCF